MLRGLLFIIATIIVITVLRVVIGLIGRAVGELFQPDTPQKRTPSGGELVQDPVCGIYVSTETRLKKTVEGKTYHFCSEGCMKRFQG